MKSTYKRHRLPPEIISHAIWLYHWFKLRFRDVSKQFTTDSSEAGLFPIGKRQRVCSEGLQASLHFEAIMFLLPLTCQYRIIGC
jgi:hypothetical protein